MQHALDQTVATTTRVPKIYLTLREASAAVGVSNRLLLREIRLGRLRAKRAGRNSNGNSIGPLLVSVEALRTWFDQLPDA